MSSSMNLIIENLFLGSVEAALDVENLLRCGVTHILTIDIRPLCQGTTDRFKTKYIHALDLDDTDLLTYFDECNTFIDEGRENGGVLVNCFVGSSRSATIVLAYIMNIKKLNVREAFGMVKSLRPIIKPNYGFKQQLILYEKMGSKIDVKSDSYRQYRLDKLSLSVQAGIYGEHIPDNVLKDQTGETQNPSYKCRKCRQLLFRSNVLLPHVAGKGEAAFDWRNKLGSEDGEDDVPESGGVFCDKSLFIEPMKWMSSYVHNMEGKLACPKCAAKIGSFIWYGERCPCGTWVAPAFHIQSSKVDLCKPIVNIVKTNAESRPGLDLQVIDNPGPTDILSDL